MSLPDPIVFGLPNKFRSWRQYQAEAVEAMLEQPNRFRAMVLPTGSGKTLLYVVAALLSGKRAVILTSSKALQEQIMEDFGPIGMVDIRGKNNYPCNAAGGSVACDQGPCVSVSYKCQVSCGYHSAVMRARNSNLVVTNYHYWMSFMEYSDPIQLGKFDLMVCDEAHLVDQTVSGWLTVRVTAGGTMVNKILPLMGDTEIWNLEDYRDWSRASRSHVQYQADELGKLLSRSPDNGAMRRDYIKARALVRDLAKVAAMGDDWVASDTGSGRDRKLEFSPVWPGRYMESVLWRGVGQVVLVSATLARKTLGMLGLEVDSGLGQLGSDHTSDLLEFPHTFPLDSRRLLHIPTVRLNARSTDMDIRLWLARIDQIVGARLDRNGIIHTVSYARRDRVIAESRHAGSGVYMTHGKGDAGGQIAKFKSMWDRPPVVMVSPSVSTGYDFPMSQAEYQIIGKIAYPDTRDPITRVRCQQDSEYGAYVAMQQLVQSTGRIVRGKLDRGETFVIDDSIGWFLSRHRNLAPRWFWEAYMQVGTIPVAPDKITGMGEMEEDSGY